LALLRRTRSALAITLAVVAASAGGGALADPAMPTCWPGGTTPGLFDWPTTPSLACRDAGRTEQAAGPDTPDAAPTVARTEPGSTAQTSTGSDGPAITFSGHIYVGVGVAF
jgi:hypothetical protein